MAKSFVDNRRGLIVNTGIKYQPKRVVRRNGKMEGYGDINDLRGIKVSFLYFFKSPPLPSDLVGTENGLNFRVYTK